MHGLAFIISDGGVMGPLQARTPYYLRWASWSDVNLRCGFVACWGTSSVSLRAANAAYWRCHLADEELGNTSNIKTVRLGAFSATACLFAPRNLVDFVR